MKSALVRSVLLILVTCPLVIGRSALADQGTKDEKGARAEREKKALALADEVIKETEALKIPENRIRIQISLAGSLWPRDEKRAVLLFKQATASLIELVSAVNSNPREYSNIAHMPMQLRQELLQVASTRDPKLALDFLRSTRPY